MLSRLSLFFITIFFQLPLFILHGLGGFLGRVAYQFDRRFKERIDANLKRASISSDENDLKKTYTIIDPRNWKVSYGSPCDLV